MSSSLFFITGASRGLGKAFAEFALKQDATVVGLSRSTTKIQNQKYFHHNIDLANLSDSSELKSIFQKQTDPSKVRYETITLINNAGMISPIGTIGNVSSDQLIQNFNVNLIVPVLLSNAFLETFQKSKENLAIAHVTSGVAKFPKATWAAYSAAKAGLNAFAEATAKENLFNNRVKIICYEPGIIDTEMQSEIRSMPEITFPEVQKFIDFKKSGELKDPMQVAQNLWSHLMKSKNSEKYYYSISE